MGDRTSIEWTDATWNPTSGCSKVSQGCKYCYAERMFHRPYPGRDFTDVRVHHDRLDQPLRWKIPRRIFVNSMSDLFHDKVPTEFIDKVFAIMSQSPQHTFHVLTKRPERMFDYLCQDVRADCVDQAGIDQFGWCHSNVEGRWPLPNVWLGVSVEDQKSADERIPILLETPAAVRFVSYEPALGPVDFSSYISPYCERCEIPDSAFSEGDMDKRHTCKPRLDWVIAGGESGLHARPSHPDWFRSVRDQCQDAGVPFFFQQRGEWTWTEVDKKVRPTHVMCEHGYYERDGLSFHCIEGSCAKPGRIVQPIAKVGKKRAGRILDGQEWNEFPI